MSRSSVQPVFYVANSGHDDWPGTEQFPFASLNAAQSAVRSALDGEDGPVTVLIRGGTYYLKEPLVLTPGDSGTAFREVTYKAYPGERVTLSGGRRLDCCWDHYHEGIYRCQISTKALGIPEFTQLFVNGRRQIRARFPKFDASDPNNYSGYLLAAGRLEDDLPCPEPGADDDMTFSSGAPRGIYYSPETFTQRRWPNPKNVVIHIYQANYWGNLQWRIRHIDWDKHIIWFGDGGQQMGAKWAENPCAVNENSRFYVENVFEELDLPGEWYYDRGQGYLYYYPETGLNLADAVIEVSVLPQVIRFLGTQADPVHHISIERIRITHTTSTFLEPYSVPSLSDWAIHRGGAVFMEGVRDCSIRDCFFDAVGGNAVFMNQYNRGNTVSGCTFNETGDSAICFVGSLETTVGTQRNFPFECKALNNLIHDCGVFGKQIAGIYISRAKRITASHNKIYRMPRAGICIGDGTWGGHVIEFNHIYDTCRETGDHGPFNAWGRDKYWCLVQSHSAYSRSRSHDAGNVLVDAMEPVIVRNNFFEETSGWGLDLDDGASNYEIYNNLCVGVSVKLREGAYRTVFNNIWVNGANSPCFHVGNEINHDRYFRNITVMSVANLYPENDLSFDMGHAYGEIYTLIAPPVAGPWLEEIDYNCFFSDLGEFVARVRERGEGVDWHNMKMPERKLSLKDWQALGFDCHSVFADPQFVDPAHNDYRLLPESPAISLGFISFDGREAGLTMDFLDIWHE